MRILLLWCLDDCWKKKWFRYENKNHFLNNILDHMVRHYRETPASNQITIINGLTIDVICVKWFLYLNIDQSAYETQ